MHTTSLPCLHGWPTTALSLAAAFDAAKVGRSLMALKLQAFYSWRQWAQVAAARRSRQRRAVEWCNKVRHQGG
jgi:hypothetical protein